MAVNDQHERSQRAHRTETIKQKALKLGFEKVGVARAEALADESDHLRESDPIRARYFPRRNQSSSSR